MSEPRSKRIRILLVDDHPVVRQGLRAILSTFDEIAIAGEASGGREAVSVARELKPDVILMDISMPEMSGIEATALLTRDVPESKVLALSMHENRTYINQALSAGARGYILKDSAPKELAQAISNVYNGTCAISPRAATILVNNAFQRRGQPGLTPRELEVLRFLARGYTNKEIATELNLGVRTIETHRENLIKKTGLSSVAELTRYAVEQGHIELNPAV